MFSVPITNQAFSSEFQDLKSDSLHYINLDESSPNGNIPEWFKNNALWWKDNAISDEEIISAIEYLINRKVIVLEDSLNYVKKDNSISQVDELQKAKIPAYVKDVFGDWGSGVASDNEVKNVIKYLIEQNVTSLNKINQQKQTTPISIGDEILVIDGAEIPNGWRQAVDPSITKIDDQWWMFFSSQDVETWKNLGVSDSLKSNGPRIFILSASLPHGQPIGTDSSLWKISPDGVKISPIISPSSVENDDWDSHATETPKYVRGYDNNSNLWVERIYYTGWDRTSSKQPDYAIGFAQKEGDYWIKHPNPIIVASEPWEKHNDISAIGDQAVLYEPGQGPNGEEGLWHMWYQAYDGNDGSISYVSSMDGITWSEKQRLSHQEPFPNAKPSGGLYSLDVFAHNENIVLFGWVPSNDLTMQGLWRTTSSDVSENFANWKPLYENNGVDWHDSGLEGSGCHKTGLYGPTAVLDDDHLWLFYHGVSADDNTNPCVDLSTNVASIGQISIGKCDSKNCRFVE